MNQLSFITRVNSPFWKGSNIDTKYVFLDYKGTKKNQPAKNPPANAGIGRNYGNFQENYMDICMCVCMYVYLEREGGREREVWNRRLEGEYGNFQENYMDICICVCIYVCIYRERHGTYTYIHIHIHTYIHTYIYLYI